MLSSGNETPAKASVLPVLVTGIHSAQVFGLNESFDPTDVGSLDPRHKGEDDGNVEHFRHTTFYHQSDGTRRLTDVVASFRCKQRYPYRM
jgi:hypothetical protein